MIAENFLDLYDIFVNELVGDIWLFTFIGLALIFWFSARHKIPFQVSVIFSVLFISIVVSTIYNALVWVTALLTAGILFYFMISRILNRG